MFRFALSKIRLTKNPKDMRNRALLNKAEHLKVSQGRRHA